MKKRIREKARRSRRIYPFSEHEWKFACEEFLPSQVGPFLRLKINEAHGRKTVIDAKQFLGTSHLNSSRAFSDYRHLKTMPSDDLLDILRENLSPRFNIFGLARMARRYGESPANFRRMALKYGAPIKYDRAIWAARQSRLDSWYLEADRRRREAKEKSRGNLIRMTGKNDGGRYNDRRRTLL